MAPTFMGVAGGVGVSGFQKYSFSVATKRNQKTSVAGSADVSEFWKHLFFVVA
jgi:hypothetical protein